MKILYWSNIDPIFNIPKKSIFLYKENNMITREYKNERTLAQLGNTGGLVIMCTHCWGRNIFNSGADMFTIRGAIYFSVVCKYCKEEIKSKLHGLNSSPLEDLGLIRL